MSYPTKLPIAAAKAMLSTLIEKLVWDEELQQFIMPEGAIYSADKEVVELAKQFVNS